MVQLLVHPRHRASLPTAALGSAVGRGIRSAPPALLIVVVGAVRLLQLVSLQLILLLVLSQLVLLVHLPNKHASLFMARH